MPFGSASQKSLWRYHKLFRPEPMDTESFFPWTTCRCGASGRGRRRALAREVIRTEKGLRSQFRRTSNFSLEGSDLRCR